MAKDEDPDDLDLPDKDAAKGFYAKYEPKEILGRYARTLLKCNPISWPSSAIIYDVAVD